MEKLPLTTKKELEVLKNYKGSFSLNGKNYFYKPNSDNVELVIEKITDMLGILSPHYMVQNVLGIPYYFSEDLGNGGEFISADALCLDNECLPEAFDYFDRDYPECAFELKRDLIKIYLMDIILMNHDRNSTNWGLVIKDGKVRVGILDNDLSFTISSVTLSAKRKPPYFMRKYLENPGFVNDAYNDLDYFLNNYGDAYTEMFYKVYELLDLKYIEKLFELIEKEYKVSFRKKELYLEMYSAHYERIKYMFIDNKANKFAY